MPDFRSLISRMADELDHYRQLLTDDRRETHALAVEARAALAEPEPANGEVAELVARLEEMSNEAVAANQFSDSEMLDRAVDLLERLSPLQPS